MKVGKEAFILHADRFPNVIGKREKCVVKMFKTDFFQFKLQEKYVKYNPNFKDKIDKQNMGKYSQLWAERERDNLIRLKNADIPCPEVITLKQHLLIMSFIGENYRPALTLKDANLSDQKFNDAYLQVIKAMKTMYEKENLIHGDLSEDNILWFKECCYFIDVGQAMAPTDVNAYNFLYRDCQKITDESILM
ncbi:hypothetical protein NQ318_014015 [Aromia moschata]|uniref:non-specific serine/threonine protein kinase n=1 Tax=Aromia moschata TaxID=1265417 RepID=A0AAV8YZW7_9CUCU|nr:hypothetical protein NQ318_014015 [Aromia moschata]